jgi:hypothetical protein
MASPTLVTTTIFFVQLLVDVIRIRFTFNRVFSDTAITAQLELLGCIEGKNEY